MWRLRHKPGVRHPVQGFAGIPVPGLVPAVLEAVKTPVRAVPTARGLAQMDAETVVSRHVVTRATITVMAVTVAMGAPMPVKVAPTLARITVLAIAMVDVCTVAAEVVVPVVVMAAVPVHAMVHVMADANTAALTIVRHHATTTVCTMIKVVSY